MRTAIQNSKPLSSLICPIDNIELEYSMLENVDQQLASDLSLRTFTLQNP